MWSPPFSLGSEWPVTVQVADRLFFSRSATPSRIALAMFVSRLLAASNRISSLVDVSGFGAEGTTTGAGAGGLPGSSDAGAGAGSAGTDPAGAGAGSGSGARAGARGAATGDGCG